MWPFSKKQAAPSKKRRYQAAKIGRLYDSWAQTPEKIDTELLRDGTRLISRARDLAQNNDYAARYLGLAVSNVIGSRGIRLQSQVPRGREVGSDGRDDGAIKAIESGWREWGRSADITEKLRWIDVQRLFLVSLLRDGEAILRHRVGRSRFAYSVQLIDPVALDHQLNKRLNENEIVMGVELDSDRRPVNYYFKTDVRAANGGATILDNQGYVVVPAREIIHAYTADRSGQTRGVTAFAATMLRAHNLEGYEESVIVASRVAASTMAFFTQNAEGEGYTGDRDDGDGNIEVDLQPGTFFQLPNGVGMEMFKAEQPAAVYADFVKQTLRGMAAGLNISYHSLANDLSDVNFSSARVGLLEDREVWRGLQTFVIDYLCRPVFERWLDAQLAAGTLTINDNPLRVRDRQRYLAAEFVGRRWAWVDPLKESQATGNEVDLRTRSISDVIRDRGADPEEVWREIAADNAKLAELGIAIAEKSVTKATELEPGP